MKNHILVTGGCGSIGSRLIKTLLSSGNVTVLNVDRTDGPHPESDDYSYMKGDIRSFDYSSELGSKKVDFIIHLAAESDEKESFGKVLEFHETNVSGTLRLLEFARNHGVRHILFTSSGGVKAVDGKSARTPRSPYVATKMASEQFAEVHHRLHGLDVSIFRIYELYGKGVGPTVLQGLLNQCTKNDVAKLPSSEQRFHPVHVDDVAMAISKALSKPNGYCIYELGDSEAVSDDQIVSITSDILKKQISIERIPNQPPFNSADPDPSSLHEYLQLNGLRDLKAGIAHAIDG